MVDYMNELQLNARKGGKLTKNVEIMMKYQEDYPNHVWCALELGKEVVVSREHLSWLIKKVDIFDDCDGLDGNDIEYFNEIKEEMK
jgi:hypothetical protein